MTFSFKVLEKLIEKNLKISFVESMTGGFLSYELIKYDNASKIIHESFITYNINSKKEILGIDDIEKYSIVSKEMSFIMAKKLFEKNKCNIAVSITGNANANYQINTDKLNAFYTIYMSDFNITEEITFSNNQKEENIKKSSNIIYKKLYDILNS